MARWATSNGSHIWRLFQQSLARTLHALTHSCVCVCVCACVCTTRHKSVRVGYKTKQQYDEALFLHNLICCIAIQQMAELKGMVSMNKNSYYGTDISMTHTHVCTYYIYRGYMTRTVPYQIGRVNVAVAMLPRRSVA